MWNNFILKWDGKEWPCEAQVFERPSIFGIRDGRVSRFFVYDDNGDWIYSYERGWGKKAPDGLIDELMKMFPETRGN